MALHSLAAPARRGRRGRLSVRHAVVLGLIQGPAEVLPVSSSGHLVLIPALLDWPYARLPADVRKAFEVALHAGAGMALLLVLRREAIAAARDPLGTTLMTAPAAAVALAFEDSIERKASDPRVTATAMVVAGAALGASGSRIPNGGAWHPTGAKGARPPLWLSQFLVGIAQIAALVPGVSRNGATLTAARALGFDRESAARLSWQAGLPIIGGATALKLVRLAQRGLDRELHAPFAAGAGAAFAATLVASPLLRVRRQRVIAAYRVALGAFALHRLEWPRG